MGYEVSQLIDKVQRFHEHLNSIETTIQFAVKMESEGTLLFLDTRIMHHSAGSLSTTVFRKAHTWTSTWTSNPIPSLRTRWQWPAFYSTMLRRSAWTAQTSQTGRKRRNMLQRRTRTTVTPEGLWWRTGIHHHAHNCLSKTHPQPQLPYRTSCHLSETIRRILAPLGIHTLFRTHCTLRQTSVRLKNHTPLQQRAGVLYRIPRGLCSEVSIDQMSRTMEHRLKEHKRALTSRNTAQSAVAKHAVDQMHEINFERSRSGWLPSALPSETCIGSLAHLYGTPDNEPWQGTPAIGAQLLNSLTETSCSLTT